MNWKEFEDNIKKEVQNHPSEMDLQDFWEQVAPEKKKRYPIWIILLPIILATTGYFLLKNHSSSPLLEKQEKNINEQKASEKVDFKPEIASAEQENKSSVQTNNDSKQLIENELTAVSNNKVLKKSASKKTFNHINKVPVFEKNGTENSKLSKLNVNKNNQSFPENIKSNTENLITDNKTLENQSHNPRNIETDFDPLNHPISFLDIQKNEILVNRVPFLIKKHDENHLSICVLAGIGKWNSNFKTHNLEILDRNLGAEKELESRNFGVIFYYNKGIFKYFESGLIYNEYITKINWSKTWVQETPSSSNSLLSINTYINGSIDSTYGKSFKKTTYERTINQYNTFRTLTIPIYFKPRSICILDNLSFDPKIGALMDIYQQNSGKYLNSLENLTPLQTSNYVAKGLGISAELLLPITYHFNKTTSIEFSPYYRQYITNTMKQSADFQQNPNDIGIKVGYTKIIK